MGIFGKLFGALKKTERRSVDENAHAVSKNKLGDEFYENWKKF